jgi:hypothetical protein
MAAARINVTETTIIIIITKLMMDDNQNKYNTSTATAEQQNMTVKYVAFLLRSQFKSQPKYRLHGIQTELLTEMLNNLNK